MPNPRGVGACAALISLPFILLGCQEPTAPSVDDGPARPESARGPTQHTDQPSGPLEDERRAFALLTEHVNALRDRDATRYAATLADDFEFFPRNEDLIDLPWLKSVSWGRTDELGMIAHMCDSTHVIPELGAGIRSIEVHTSAPSVVHTPTGVSVTCYWAIIARTTDGNGMLIDTRLEISAVPARGTLQVDAIRELPLFGEAVPQSSWGLMKALLR